MELGGLLKPLFEWFIRSLPQSIGHGRQYEQFCSHFIHQMVIPRIVPEGNTHSIDKHGKLISELIQYLKAVCEKSRVTTTKDEVVEVEKNKVQLTSDSSKPMQQNQYDAFDLEFVVFTISIGCYLLKNYSQPSRDLLISLSKSFILHVCLPIIGFSLNVEEEEEEGVMSQDFVLNYFEGRMEQAKFSTLQAQVCYALVDLSFHCHDDSIYKILWQICERCFIHGWEENKADVNLNNNAIHILSYLLVQMDDEIHTSVKLFTDQLFVAILESFKNLNEQQRKSLATRVLPFYFKQCTPERLQILWYHLKSWKHEGSQLRTEAYALLVQFYDKFFAILEKGTKLYFAFDLRQDDTFFEMIQNGLLEEDASFTRKRCSFLLKRIIDTSSAIYPNGSDKFIPMEKPTRYFSWNFSKSQELQKQWELFFLIYSQLDNHSLHLIQPLWSELFLKMIPKKHETREAYLDFYWIKLLIIRGFNHANFSIKRLALITFLEYDFNVLEPINDEVFICETLVDHVNEPRLYFKKGRIGEKLVKFYRSYILSHEREHDRCRVVKKLLFTLQDKLISRVTMSYFLKALHNIGESEDAVGHIPFDNESLEYLENILEKHCSYNTLWIQLRQSSYIVDILTKNVDLKRIDLMRVWKIFDSIHSHIFEDKTSFMKIVNWIQPHIELISSELHLLLEKAYEEEDFSVSCAYLSRYAKILPFLLCAKKSLMDTVMGTFFENLSKIYTHTHVKMPTHMKSLFLLHRIFQESNSCKMAQIEDLSEYIFNTKISSNILEHILSFISCRVLFPTESLQSATSVARAIIGISKEVPFTEFTDLIRYTDTCLDAIDAMASIFINSSIHQTLKQLIDKATNFLSLVADAFSNQKLNCDGEEYIGNIFQRNAFSVISKVEKLYLKLQLPDDILPYEKIALIIETSKKVDLFKVNLDSSKSITENLSIVPAALASQTFYSKWESINFALQLLDNKIRTKEDGNKDVKKIMNSEFLDFALESLDYIKAEDCIVVIDSLKYILPWVEIASSHLVNTIDTVMRLLETVGRKMEMECYFSFLSGILRCEYVFQDSKLVKSIIKKKITEPLLRFCNKSMRAIAPLTFFITSVMIQYKDMKELFIEDIIGILLFCPETGEDEELETCSFGLASSQYNMTHTGYYPEIYKVSKIARVMIYYGFSSVLGSECNNESFVSLLVKSLLDANLNEQGGKSISMPASPCHRRKVRVWKFLLWLVPFITENVASKILQPIWKLLYIPNNISVRRLIEFFYVSMALKFPKQYIKNLEITLKKVNERVQVMSSLLLISGNILLHANLEELQDLFRRLHNLIAVYTLTHNHSMRVISHLMLQHIYERIEKHAPHIFNDMGNEWLQSNKDIYNYITNNEQCIKWCQKHKDEFIFQSPNEYLKIENLLGEIMFEHTQIIDEHLPLGMFNLLCEEKLNQILYSLCLASGCGLDIGTMTLRIDAICRQWRNEVMKSLTHHPPQKIVAMKTADVEEKIEHIRNMKEQQMLEAKQDKSKNIQNYHAIQQRELHGIIQKEGEEEQKREILNFQRKILVWSGSELESEVNPRHTLANRKRQPLIVMASYIDRIPNLAGLSRTCEIFQVQKLVIPNKKMMETDEFRSISVGANLWLPIEECQEDNIAQYLKQKKVEGFTIVGVEQTSNSVSLEKFVYNPKSVLVLGKEKEGIPSPLLQLIDVCVEIPQFGIIRSLNVHVSASIMIYEYTKQQLLG